jgi:hypothetical protein
MSFAPKQDWDAYHALVNPTLIAREFSLSATQKHKRYMEIFNHVCAAKANDGSDGSIRPDGQLAEKLKLRGKLLSAYRLATGPDGE